MTYHLIYHVLIFSVISIIPSWAFQLCKISHTNQSDFDYPTQGSNCYHHTRTLPLSAGRERRMTSSNERYLEEQNLISDEEESRKRRIGQMKQRIQKSVSREDRISSLEAKLKYSKSVPDSDTEEYITKAEYAELQGLLKVRQNFEEQYDPLSFTKEHLEFKEMHNDAFIQLAKYCASGRLMMDSENSNTQPINVFFLDGPDGGTASALINQGGFQAKQCFVANRHESSCESLRVSGGGLLPDQNVVHATASEALTIAEPISIEGVQGTSAGENDIDVASLTGEDGSFAHIDFAAYYFDGCGGFVPHLVGMLSAALLRQNCDASKQIAVGYSLLGGNKDVVGKELSVSRALTIIARKRGMRVVHALDDPLRFGLRPGITKVGGSGGGGTFTTWLLLER